MNLFLDDLRPFPTEEGWVCVRSYKDCIFALGTKKFELVTLDYMLSDKFTGLDVVQWMAENKRFPKRLNVHSSSPYGVTQMVGFAKRHFPKSCIITSGSPYSQI